MPTIAHSLTMFPSKPHLYLPCVLPSTRSPSLPPTRTPCSPPPLLLGLEHEMLLEQHLSALGIPFWTESDMRAHGYFKTPDIWLQVTLGGGEVAARGPASIPLYIAAGLSLWEERGREGGGGAWACFRGTVIWLQTSSTGIPVGLLRGASIHSTPTPDVWLLQVPVAVLDRQAPSAAGPSWRVVSWIDSKATFGDDRIHAKQLEEQYSTYVNRYGPGLVIYWFGCIDGLGQGDVMVMDAFPAGDALCTLPLKP